MAMDLSDYLHTEAKHCGCKTSQTWALDKKRTAVALLGMWLWSV